jgi:hypothetical protein
VFRQRVFVKYDVEAKFVANTCLRIRRDGIMNFHNTHVWVDENSQTTVASRHPHRFSINVCVGILGDHLPGPVGLPNRLTGAAYHRFLFNDLPVMVDDLG